MPEVFRLNVSPVTAPITEPVTLASGAAVVPS